MTTVDIFHLKFYFKGINDSLRRCQEVFASEKEFWCIKAWFPFNISDREVAASCNISRCWKYFCPFIPAHTACFKLPYGMMEGKILFADLSKILLWSRSRRASREPTVGDGARNAERVWWEGRERAHWASSLPTQHINKVHQRLGRSGMQHTPSWSNETIYSALELPPSLEVCVSFQ